MGHSDQHVAAVCFVAYCGVQGVMHIVDEWTEGLPSVEDSQRGLRTARRRASTRTTRPPCLPSSTCRTSEPVTIDQVSPYVLEGTVATEDERYLPSIVASTSRASSARCSCNLSGGAWRAHPPSRSSSCATRCFPTRPPKSRSSARSARAQLATGDGEEVLQQRRNPPYVPQHHQLRRRLLRHRGGCRRTTSGVNRRLDLTIAAGRHARRHPQLPHHVRQPGHLNPEDMPWSAATRCFRSHAHQRRHHEGRTRRGAGRAPDAQPGAHALGGRHLPVSVLHQLRAPAAAREPVVRPGVRRRADRVHHHRPHAAGSGMPSRPRRKPTRAWRIPATPT